MSLWPKCHSGGKAAASSSGKSRQVLGLRRQQNGRILGRQQREQLPMWARQLKELHLVRYGKSGVMQRVDDPLLAAVGDDLDWLVAAQEVNGCREQAGEHNWRAGSRCAAPHARR